MFVRSSVRATNQGTVGSLRMKLALLSAVATAVLVFAIPASASAAFGIPSFSVTPSTTTKAANPNLAVSFTRSGTASEDLRDSALHLPGGLGFTTSAVATKCTSAQFSADSCPAASKLGSSALTADVAIFGMQ